MPLTWAEGLDTRLRAADIAIKGPNAPSTSGIWTSLAGQVAPAERRPVMVPNLVVRELHDRQTPYLVLKNPETRTYMRVTPEDYQLVQKLDGENSVQDLIVDHYMETGEFSRAKVFHLVQKLHQNHMLTEQPLFSWGQVQDALDKETWAYKLSAPAKFILTRRLNIPHLDRLIGKIYRGGGRIFFSRPFQILFLLVSLLGLAAFIFIVREGTLAFFGENLIRSIAGFYAAAVFTILVHELGHALTVKHYGREVHKGGLLLFFGMPAAFVDTTDIWLEPRRARLAVTWNGPYTGLILGGLASLLIYSFPGSPGNLLLYQLAGYAYATVFININPLLKLDGYYLLLDALDISSLRERSIYFVTRKLLPGIFHKEKFGREERIFSVYGLLTILWTGYALYFAFFFWRTRISRSLQGLFSAAPTFFGIVRTLLIALLVTSFGALLIFSVLKLGKILKKTGGPVRAAHKTWNLRFLAGRARLSAWVWRAKARSPIYPHAFSPFIFYVVRNCLPLLDGKQTVSRGPTIRCTPVIFGCPGPCRADPNCRRLGDPLVNLAGGRLGGGWKSSFRRGVAPPAIEE